MTEFSKCQNIGYILPDTPSNHSRFMALTINDTHYFKGSQKNETTAPHDTHIGYSKFSPHAATHPPPTTTTTTAAAKARTSSATVTAAAASGGAMTNLLYDAIEQFAASHELDGHVIVLGVIPEELVDIDHIGVL